MKEPFSATLQLLFGFKYLILHQVLAAGGIVCGASLALVGVAGGVVQAATTKEQFPWLLKEVDHLYDNDKMREALELLQPLGEEGEEEEVEVLWRLARLCYKVMSTSCVLALV